MLTTQEAVGILLSSELDDSSVCSRVPFSVESNCVFILDLNKLSSPNDVTCDDMGVWTWGGSKKRWVSVEDDGFTTFLKKSDNPGNEKSHFLVWKRYYSHKSSPDVKKMIIVLQGMWIKVVHCHLTLALSKAHLYAAIRSTTVFPPSLVTYCRTTPD